MKWKDLSISIKLGIAFGGILLLTLIVGLVSTTGIATIIKDERALSEDNIIHSQILEAEIAHMNWAKQVAAFLADPNIHELDVQLDDRKCAFGKWLYGEERKHAEEMLPALVPPLKEIEPLHHELHASAAEIKKHYKNADPHLPLVMAEREVDHLNFVNKIQLVFSGQASTFNVETDPQKCKLGQWLYGDGAKKAIEADPGLKPSIDGLLDPHARLHGSVVTMQGAWVEGDADAQTATKEIFSSATMPALLEIKKGLDSIKQGALDNMAGLNKANEIYLTVSSPALDKVRGVLKHINEEVEVIMEKEEAHFIAKSSQTRQLVIAIVLVAIGAGVIVSFFLARKISGPIALGVGFAQKVADGDLRETLAIDQKDEIGRLAAALNTMSAKLRQVMTDISEKSNMAAASSEELSATSEEMASGAEELSTQAASTSAATEEISANIRTVAMTAEAMSKNSSGIAAAAGEMSANVNNVSAAMEEMTASIKEVAENCSNAQRYSSFAKEKSDSSMQMIKELDQAAKDVGNVINVITEITEQTKLLALNATIEAARAGEAGKGFAVVASEVKELAKQTAEATDNIVRQIRDMQSRTGSVVHVIEEISDISDKVNQINTTIAAAVEEQTATVGEVARTIAETAQGVDGVSANIRKLSVNIEQEIITSIQEIASGAEEISRNINGVSAVAGESAQGASVIKSSAGELAGIASELQAQVSLFKLHKVTGNK
ncbi:MAG: methyl-accepting chemotaxis protein [Pseudomonadota bacterium]